MSALVDGSSGVTYSVSNPTITKSGSAENFFADFGWKFTELRVNVTASAETSDGARLSVTEEGMGLGSCSV